MLKIFKFIFLIFIFKFALCLAAQAAEDFSDSYPQTHNSKYTRSKSTTNHKKRKRSDNKENTFHTDNYDNNIPSSKHIKSCVDALDEKSFKTPPSSPTKLTSPASPFTPETKQKLKESGIEPITLAVLNCAPFHSPSKLSPTKSPVKKILEKRKVPGRQLFKDEKLPSKDYDAAYEDEIRQDLSHFKNQFPQTIQTFTQNDLPPNTVLQPVAVFSELPRNPEKYFPNLVIKPVKPLDYEEPYKPETPEERAARKEKIKKEFEEREKRRGISTSDNTSIFSQEQSIWEGYLDYIEQRKVDIDSKIDKRITKCELEDVFEEYLVKNKEYSLLQLDGYKLYYSYKFIDLDRVDDLERSNLDRLESQLCPIGHDGVEMNFHHLTRHDYDTHGSSYGYTYVVLISDQLHKEKSGPLHLSDTYCSSYPKKIVDRNIWAQVRKQMCLELAKVLKKN